MSATRIHTIATIPGDGIGVEVVEQTLRVLNTLQDLHPGFDFRIRPFDWSSKRFLATGEYFAMGEWAKLKECDAILFGAVGSPGMSTSIVLFVLCDLG